MCYQGWSKLVEVKLRDVSYYIRETQRLAMCFALVLGEGFLCDLLSWSKTTAMENIASFRTRSVYERALLSSPSEWDSRSEDGLQVELLIGGSTDYRRNYYLLIYTFIMSLSSIQKESKSSYFCRTGKVGSVSGVRVSAVSALTDLLKRCNNHADTDLWRNHTRSASRGPQNPTVGGHHSGTTTRGMNWSVQTNQLLMLTDQEC